MPSLTEIAEDTMKNIVPRGTIQEPFSEELGEFFHLVICEEPQLYFAQPREDRNVELYIFTKSLIHCFRIPTEVLLQGAERMVVPKKFSIESFYKRDIISFHVEAGILMEELNERKKLYTQLLGINVKRDDPHGERYIQLYISDKDLLRRAIISLMGNENAE